jgi:hypothetical protein
VIQIEKFAQTYTANSANFSIITSAISSRAAACNGGNHHHDRAGPGIRYASGGSCGAQLL